MADQRATGTNLLNVDEEAPDFTLLGSDGDLVTLSDFRGHMNVCLFFYPEDASPDCTRQLCAARDDRDAFIAADVERFGVNPGSLESHQRFAEHHDIDFPLLVDADRAVARMYGAYDPEADRVRRIVYVIDKEGDVAFRSRGYPSTREILEPITR